MDCLLNVKQDNFQINYHKSLHGLSNVGIGFLTALILSENDLNAMDIPKKLVNIIVEEK